MAEPEAAGVFHLLSGYALNAVKHAKNWILCAGGSGYYVLPLDTVAGYAVGGGRFLAFYGSRASQG